MLRARATVGALRFLRFSSSSSHQPNAPLDLDKSFKAILRDIDHSIAEQKLNRHHALPDIHELTAYPTDSEVTELAHEDDEGNPRANRKSPAAHFGSQRLGAVVLPQELQQTISALISDSDKRLLRRDAKRLFNEHGDDNDWDPSLNVHYKSYKQVRHHAERDGTAFVSVVLPAHYSAIYSVLHHLKSRMGPQWSVQNVLDWGAGSGSALWAAGYAFQKFSAEDESPQVTLSSTAIVKYVGIETRDGLVSVGKGLLEDVPHDSLDITWHKRPHPDSHPQTYDGSHTIAISAFFMSTLETPWRRKRLVKEMWESGAGTIVLLDHSSTTGFQCIAEARELLLDLGRKEIQNGESSITGSHVLAPCPHDGVCPIYQSNVAKRVCGFSQRIERPPFVRHTKHSGVGHEDIEYSYVVIRRGPRPSIPAVKVGRLGEVGRSEMQLEAAKRPPVQLELDDGNTQASPIHDISSTSLEKSMDEPAELEDLMKAEAFHWPRLVLPPLKKSGHVVMDVCSPSGEILRMTVPKSQGKQPYYDARKSSWGDIFPHEPKNPPQVKYPQRQDQPDNGRKKTCQISDGRKTNATRRSHS